MKNILKYFIVLGFIMVFAACEKKAEEPEILLFEAVPSTIVAGEEVTFRIRAEGDYISLWTGDEEEGGRNNRNYDSYLEEINNPPDTNESVNRFYNKGIALSITDTSYLFNLYTDAGTYEAVLIVTNVGKLGEEIKRTQARTQVEVLEAPE